MGITLQKIMRDERLLYWLLVIFAAIPLIFPVAFPIPIGSLTKKTYDAVENLKENDLVLFTVNMGVTGLPTIGPLMDAYATHLAQVWELRKIKVILWSTAVADAALVVENNVIPYFEKAGMKNEEDYINVGYIPGELTAVAALATDPKSVVTTDYYGKPLSQIPLWSRVTHAKDFDLVIVVSGNEIYYYMQFWGDPFGVRLLSTTGSPSLGPIAPYLEQGSLYGIIAGKTAAAEYELLQGRIGEALGDVSSISFEHILFLFLLILGNLGEIYNRFGGGKK